MEVLITGGAGFIGGHLAKSLVEKKFGVICVDNLVLGKKSNIQELVNKPGFFFYEEDVSNIEKMMDIFNRHKIELVYHLAANSDIQKGGREPSIDFTNSFLTTISVLECMRRKDINKLFFASTSAVYGEKIGIDLTEQTGDLAPVSYYGGAKFASEAFISAYSAMNELSTTIFRFPNVIGPKLTHGVIYDFKRKLEANPKRLEILGDGMQCKPYMHVNDLIKGILQITTENMQPGMNIFNIGVATATTVTRIADIMCEEMGLSDVVYEYTGGNRGWKGDVPTFKYNLDKIHSTGWVPKFTSDEAVRETIKSILDK